MHCPHLHHTIATHHNTVALQALVPAVVNAINMRQLIPLGDYGGDRVYLFEPMRNGMGSIRYTQFDKTTNIGLASWLVRYGAATTIYQVLFELMPRTSIELMHVILPLMPDVMPCGPQAFIPQQHAGPARGTHLRNTVIPQ